MCEKKPGRRYIPTGYRSRYLYTGQYSLYSDFYWYEIGDMISIGNEKVQYYCFPQNSENVVARTRLATEEMYKMAIHNIGEKNHD